MTRLLEVSFIVALSAIPMVRFTAKHGTLVVCIVSKKNNYVVIGAESRNSKEVYGASRQPDNRACKIIGLGGNTVFFESGVSVAGTLHGKRWDADEAARNAFRNSSNREPEGLSVTWGNRALSWFYDSGQLYNLRSLVEANDGRIVTGGFIAFDTNLSFRYQTIFYDSAKRQLSRRQDGLPPGPGQVFTVGVAQDLISEFFEGKTNRAIDAFGPRGAPRLIGVDAVTDSQTVRNAIEFVMRYAADKDKASLGEPIDIAILRAGSPIQWIDRKPECTALDWPSSDSQRR